MARSQSRDANSVFVNNLGHQSPCVKHRVGKNRDRRILDLGTDHVIVLLFDGVSC